MTQESANVALIRRVVESFSEGDLDYPFQVYAADVVWVHFTPPPPGMDQVYEGHEGVRRFWREWLSSWEWVEFEQERYIDAGDKVVVFQRTHARGRTSGVETELGDYAQLWTLSDGMVTHVKFFLDRSEALTDAGVTDAAG